MPTLPISKILSPVDFSERAEDATGYALKWAAHFSAPLTLLHVMEPLHIDFAAVELPDVLVTLAASRKSVLQKRLDRFAVPAVAGVPIARCIMEGDPADQILEYTRRAGVDFLVMPTQGHGRIREFLIGSVTAKVLHDCECPVLTGVHLEGDQYRPIWPVRSILCAIDFGAQSEAVLKWGAALSKEFGASVTVLHVTSDLFSQDDVAPDKAATERLFSFIGSTGLVAEAVIDAGEPHQVVAETARSMKADLVIIGRGSHNSGLGRLRAQAYGIVRKSPCPVLSV